MSLLSQLDIAGLRLLSAAVETGSISADAARCHLSLAAASKRISDLESRLAATCARPPSCMPTTRQ